MIKLIIKIKNKLYERSPYIWVAWVGAVFLAVMYLSPDKIPINESFFIMLAGLGSCGAAIASYWSIRDERKRRKKSEQREKTILYKSLKKMISKLKIYIEYLDGSNPFYRYDPIEYTDRAKSNLQEAAEELIEAILDYPHQDCDTDTLKQNAEFFSSYLNDNHDTNKIPTFLKYLEKITNGLVNYRIKLAKEIKELS